MTDFVTHSLLKTFRRCPRAALYKYHDSLAPRVLAKPLKRGQWLHQLLEAYYLGNDWKAVHKTLTHGYSELFDEEKDALGNLPYECYKLMRSYLWHYRNDATWKVHEVEFMIEGDLPNGIRLQGKADMLIEEPNTGLWLVDHKSHQTIPGLTHRILDQQSIGYIWLCRQAGIPVNGFIWNYIRTNGPKEIRVTNAGNIAKNQGMSDYPTAVLSLRRQGYDPKDPLFEPFIKSLAAQRYREGAENTSIFFQRTIMEKNKAMIAQAIREMSHTAQRFVDYDFEDRGTVERVPDRSCDWCGYRNLCTTELVGGNTRIIARKEFIKEDPFGYYDPVKAD